jgi:hypothetical protein
VAKTVLSTVVPGGSAVIELVQQALDCAHESADQVWQIEKDRKYAADPAVFAS